MILMAFSHVSLPGWSMVAAGDCRVGVCCFVVLSAKCVRNMTVAKTPCVESSYLDIDRYMEIHSCFWGLVVVKPIKIYTLGETYHTSNQNRMHFGTAPCKSIDAQQYIDRETEFRS